MTTERRELPVALVLSTLVGKYRPNVKDGNFQGDVAARGRNEALLTVARDLGLQEEYEQATRIRDTVDWENGERTIARLVAEEKAAS